MAENEEYQLQVIIASGLKDQQRAALGFAFATSAVISGVSVLVFLVIDAIAWIQDEEPLAHKKSGSFSSISDYLDILAEHNTSICLCSACAKDSCAVNEVNRISYPNISHCGFTEVAIRTSKGSNGTVVF